MGELKFKISSGLKRIIGRDLITDDYIAVFELVKNAYDAYATKVDLYFLNLKNDESKIIIIDDGKGMNYEDIINKWLFVAYSAKKDDTEDNNFDYRNRIHSNKPFAGAKGIGRFSCDRLGRYLFLETTKMEKNAKSEVLITDWDKFEENLNDEFVNISVLHETKEKSDYEVQHGTVLEITSLRSEWNRNKLLTLKNALAKLINPIADKKESNFSIIIHAPEEEEEDLANEEYYKKVNGEVGNFIFETLDIKTTKIVSTISGETIKTDLFDGGTLIYSVTEVKKYNISDISISLYYLNHPAKLTFARRMGVASRLYGHVFLYKNGFRIYPFGEPYEDPMKIDVRKSRKRNSRLGTGELIGQIEIFGKNEDFIETSSRGDGLVQNKSYEQLTEYFFHVLERLEKYVVDVQQWGLSIEDDNALSLRTRVIDLIGKLTNSQDIIDFKVADNFIELIEINQADSAENLIKNLNRIANDHNDEKLSNIAKNATDKIKALKIAKEESDRLAEEERKRASEATKKLRQQISENLFLKSINTQEFKEVISLLHHVGIYAGTIENYIKNISLRVQNGIPLTNKDIYEIMKNIGFESKKILNITAFATKANFNLKTEIMEVDLNNYFKEYINNIIPTIVGKDIKIEFTDNYNKPFKTKVKPIEINIIIDNLINNSKKAKANMIKVASVTDQENNKYVIKFVDNGIGIEKDNIQEIYNLGFTTTDGAGLGLYHVKEIMNGMGGLINAENNTDSKGTTFTLTFKTT